MLLAVWQSHEKNGLKKESFALVTLRQRRATKVAITDSKKIERKEPDFSIEFFFVQKLSCKAGGYAVCNVAIFSCIIYALTAPERSTITLVSKRDSYCS